jgi:hypothetical protein
METINSKQIEFKETPGENETVYTWTKDNEEIAKVIAKNPNSNYPRIEFLIVESLIPYYEEDKKSALDEIGEMSMYSEMESRTEDGYVHGKMKCSHNASLGVGNLVQSIKGWVSKS